MPSLSASAVVLPHTSVLICSLRIWIDRLAKIVNDPERPVQFLFSGKAHPADGAGQGLIKKIFEISQRPEFLGKIIFLRGL
jgi:glucan phosphorylase